MSDSLKDQLLKLGFRQPERKPERPVAKPQDRGPRPHGNPRHGKAQHPPQSQHRPQPKDPKPARGTDEVDLARAYALRAQTERAERERAEREAQERAREKKERRAKLAALLEGKAQNDAAAELARHFPQGDRIRRIYVTPEQLARLNRGELGVVQLQGRFVLVARDVALAAAAVSEEALVLLPDPDAPADDDIPPDLVW
ncbi:MAG TPA: DUF2058 family protein [Xanthomonadales bacterium]|nr:DUF2058 family protein [Xanthomonadales bacterium]